MRSSLRAAPLRGSAITSSGDMSYIRTLRGFRPKIEKLGNVLSVNAMRTMEQAKLDAAAVSATVEETEAIFAKSKDPETLPDVEDEPDTTEPAAKVTKRDKPRMSKRARKHAKEGTVADDGDFDVKVVGGESNSKRESVGEQFYLSTAVDLTDEARERGFDMEQPLGAAPGQATGSLGKR
eukprot:Skav204485  [mRNA]  locus=scaffold535:94510:96200:+ [translate_table: standard]